MPLVGQPSFGAPYGRPNTPSQHGRHASYTKNIDPDTMPSLQPSVERVRRHREYYLDGGDIIFLVENYLFRVHRYFFERESPVFRKQLADSAHAGAGHHRAGSSDTDPMVLHDVRTEDFSRFLWVFYNPYYSIYEASTEDWAAILGLAHHWQFSEVKALVIRELEKQSMLSITRIVIYHRYGVDRNLLLPAYMDLCQREHALDLAEAKDLGLETSLMLMTAREIVRRGDGSSSAHRTISQDDLRHIIREIFRFPEPRSDTPLSDATAADGNLASNGSDVNDHTEFSDRQVDPPHIKTDSTSDDSSTSAATGAAIVAPETETSLGDSSNLDQQLSIPLKESLGPKDGSDPQTPAVGSQAASPITGTGTPTDDRSQNNKKNKKKNGGNDSGNKIQGGANHTKGP